MHRPRIDALRRWLGRHDDQLLAALIAFVGLLEIWVVLLTPPGYHGPKLLASAGVIALAAALWQRRRAPLMALGVAVGVLTIQWAFARGVAQLPNGSFIAILLAAYTVGAHDSVRRGAAGMVVGSAVFLIQDGADLEAGYHSTRTDIGFFVLFFLAWGAGIGIQALRRRATLLEELTGQLAREREERARLAVLEERARLARELHDVVAHNVTVLAVQAGAARQVLDNDPETAKSTLRSAEESARQALGELRRLLGVLREPAAASGDDRRPPPGLHDLRELASHVERAGLAVDLVVDGEPRELSPGLDLSAYRVVQEALTNALKHAQAARATVRLDYRERELELEILDDGCGPHANGSSSGHGLAGLREQTALYGGTFEAGAGANGGFRVAAVLPFEATR
jgi:signal transduction histidine kinase